MPMTHRAAHYFLTAPPTFPIPAALRWGQIKSLGGREATANAVAESFLRGLQADEPFWGTVTAFLVQKSIPTWQVVPLLDYLKYRKDTEPNFAMKGRTPDALFRLMDEWHETLARLKTPPAQAWEPSHIQNWDETEDDILSNAVCRWQITELTNGLSLLKEGREMRHCVTTYQEKAVRGGNQHPFAAADAVGQSARYPSSLDIGGEHGWPCHRAGAGKMQSKSRPNARKSAYDAGKAHSARMGAPGTFGHRLCFVRKETTCFYHIEIIAALGFCWPSRLCRSVRARRRPRPLRRNRMPRAS